jgi:hypothetical protein
MSTRSIPELVAIIERAQALRAAHAPASEEWESASKQIAILREEMRCRTAAALGSAFAATLMGLSQRELDVPAMAGDRLLIELRKRGLTVLPRRAASPASQALERA